MQMDALSNNLQQALGPRLKNQYLLGATPPITLSGVASQLVALLAKLPDFVLFESLTKSLDWAQTEPSCVASLTDHASWTGYLTVHPALSATWPGGTVAIQEIEQPTVWSGIDRAGYLCEQHFEASLLLAPRLISPEQGAVLGQRLSAVVGIALTDSIASGPVEQLAALQDELNKQLDRLPDAAWPAYFHHAPPEAPLPDLHAIFKTEQERVVLVFDKLSGDQIREMDWGALAAGLGDDCTGLQVVTVDQLQLLLAQERPLDVVFRRNKLDWGHDPITAVSPQQYLLLRHAARLPLHILVDLLPHACLAATSEADWHKIIHDFQNKLLNVQLEHEIMVRLSLVERFKPSTILPDRKAPTAERVDAIFHQLYDWAHYYLVEMEKAVGR